MCWRVPEEGLYTEEILYVIGVLKPSTLEEEKDGQCSHMQLSKKQTHQYRGMKDRKIPSLQNWATFHCKDMFL